MQSKRSQHLLLFARPRTLLFLSFLYGAGVTAAYGQSVLGSVNGTVHDASGAVVPHATILLHRVESNVNQTITADDSGNFTALNVEPGHYDITITAPGFQTTASKGVSLIARQQLRYDPTLNVGATADTVTVSASDVGTINTENAQVSASLSPRDVLDLPANFRGAGSTSPLNVIQALPGVQPDSGAYPPSPSASPNPAVKFSIQGGLPSQSETTVDGISAQNQTSNNIQSDAFPSAEMISEIRVDGVNNNAEYGQPGEITTVTKSGTNTLHGSVYEYHQNQFLDAIPYGAGSKPHKIANDFGASLGGPVVIPHLYHGKNRTFFFGDYEGFRYPLATVIQAKVPTVAMKQGDFSRENSTLTNPFTGGQYAGQRLPSINPVAQKFLQFYPDPNVDTNLSLRDATADLGYNYLSQRRNDIDSNQFDARVDQNFGDKLNMFARYTWKNIGQLQPADLLLPDNTAIGQYRIFATSANFSFTPRLANEFRFGFTLETNGNANSFDGRGFTTSTGLNGLSLPAFFNGIPHLGFDTIQSIGARLGGQEQSRIFQYVDNVTWQVGRHALRLGTDIRHLQANTILGFTTSDNYGNLFFSAGSSATGNDFADFLIGVPFQTQVDTVNQDNRGTANAYAFYAQDNWKASDRLNLTFGIRYEYHPAFRDPGGNIGNFDPSVAKSGRLIYPDGFASRLAPAELANLNACPTAGVDNPYATGQAQNGAPCTPVLSNSQAGLPAGLRNAPTLRFEPRLGFSYRPFGNDKTAIRGGVGYYNITTTGALFYALTGTLQANVQTFNNVYGAGAPPAIVLPNISTASTNSFASGNFTPSYGSTGFYNAVKTGWQDPYSLQTNLSVDHDFGSGIGARLSYIGMHTWHLVWQPEQNMLRYNTQVRAQDQPRSAFPFPNFYQIGDRDTAAQSDYRSLQAEVTRRFTGGLSFSTAYTLAKNLADNQGTYGASSSQSGAFVDEQGGYNATYSYDRSLDYGNVTGTRRHRSLTTVLYEIPYGRGKRFGGNSGRLADAVLGGWQLSNIFLWQSGPFLTAYLPSGFADPSGTGSGTLFFRQQRPDLRGSGNTGAQNRRQWFDREAFSCPGQTGYASIGAVTDPSNPNYGYSPCNVGADGGPLPIGRFGTESVGALHGPGTVSLSSGVTKALHVGDRFSARAQATFSNVLNHTNLADPNLNVGDLGFGQITQARGSDFGGNRTGQLSLRIEF